MSSQVNQEEKRNQSVNPQQDSPLPYGYSPYLQEDEINLQDLFAAVWKTRTLWLISIIVVAAIFWGSLIVRSMALPTVERFVLPLYLTFENSEKGEYPNGTRFARSDIISTTVLNEVYQRHQLESFGLEIGAFRQSISIAPYAPGEGMIRTKYEALISENKKITPQEIDELRKRQQEELDKALANGVKIIYVREGKGALPNALLQPLLSGIATVWAIKAIEERGVLENDIQLFSKSIIQEGLINDLDYPVVLAYLKEKTQLIEANLEKLLKLPNGKIIKDSDTGLTIADLQKSLQDSLNYRLQMLEDPIHQLGISKTPAMTQLHYEEQMMRLSEERRALESKAAVVGEAQRQYRIAQQNSRATPQKSGMDQGSVALNSTGTTIPQFGDNFLDRIISMSDHASDTAYRQKLSDQRLLYQEESIELEKKIRQVQRNIQNIQNIQDNQSEHDVIIAEAISALKNGVPALVKDLYRHIAATKRIYEQLNQQTIYGTGSLYQLASEDLIVSGGGLQFPEKSKLMFVLSLVLTTFVVIPLVMLRNSMRRKKEEE